MICVPATEDDLKGVPFSCGQESIDRYFRENLFEDNDAVPYCFWAEADKQSLVGIASLSCSGIIIHSGSSFNITPAIEVKIFAVSVNFQHQIYPDDDEGKWHWSDYCLYYLLGEIADISSYVCGANHVVLYSVPEAIRFYERHKFRRFIGDMEMPSNSFISGCTPMFLNIQDGI